MKLVTFEREGKPHTGAILPDGKILDLAIAAQSAQVPAHHFATMITIIEGGEAALDAARAAIELSPTEAVRDAAGLRLLAPVRPPRLRDTVGFLQHMEQGLDRWARNLAAESDDPERAYQDLKATGKYTIPDIYREKVIYYNADHLAVSNPDDDIIWPHLSDYADFELEWACVIGKAPRGIPAEKARSAIFGYTIYNDWSARDLQLSFMQANLGPSEGKDFADSNTLGPCIVTADEIADPWNVAMTARVNGETWCNGSSATMYHGFEKTIAQFARFEDMAPGEVIGSGTVMNGSGFEQGKKLKNGDVVELEVEGIGILRNRVVIGQSPS